jgi:hypothetical protein
MNRVQKNTTTPYILDELFKNFQAEFYFKKEFIFDQMGVSRISTKAI